MTTDIALFDTHVALPVVHNHGLSELLSTRSHGGHDYAGRVYFEFPTDAHSEQVEELLWKAYSNPTSFWLRESDLVRLRYETGFERVYKAATPPGYRCAEGCPDGCRVILVAKRRGALDDGEEFVAVPAGAFRRPACASDGGRSRGAAANRNGRARLNGRGAVRTDRASTRNDRGHADIAVVDG